MLPGSASVAVARFEFQLFAEMKILCQADIRQMFKKACKRTDKMAISKCVCNPVF
jgi:hypothetical protein